MIPIGTDTDGNLIPGIPEPGDRIRILWSAIPHEDFPQHWDDAHLIRLDTAGFWWAPTDDYSGAIWTPWRHIESMEGPTPSPDKQSHHQATPASDSVSG